MQTLFAELAQQIANAPPAGSVYRRERDGIAYHYAKIPVGTDRVDSFIGRIDDPVAEAQVEKFRQGMRQARDRRRLVAMLAREGLAGPGRFLGAILDAIAHAGLFRNGAVLVGTTAYMLSEPHVGRRLPAPTLRTGDLDLAMIDIALTAETDEGMETILRHADPTFQAVLQLDPRQPPSKFRNKDGYFVDLVIQRRDKAQSNPVPLPGLEAGAAPLQHLAWLIESPIPTVALWGAGVPVAIPQPARFAVHKLILAQRRNEADRLKRSKDLDQADAIMTALYVHDPFALEDAIDDARTQGKEGWSDPIDRSLAELERKAKRG